jgi:hypothetical protein
MDERTQAGEGSVINIQAPVEAPLTSKELNMQPTITQQLKPQTNPATEYPTAQEDQCKVICVRFQYNRQVRYTLTQAEDAPL